jgi:hypothetical protein
MTAQLEQQCVEDQACPSGCSQTTLLAILSKLVVAQVIGIVLVVILLVD